MFRWGTAGTVTATAVLTLLMTWGLPRALQAIRQWRIENRQRTLLTDEQFQQLLQALRAGGTAAWDRPPSAARRSGSSAGSPSRNLSHRS